MTTNVLNTEFIKRRRTELGLSNRTLASAIGVSANGIGTFEPDASQADVTLGLLTRLATALICPVAALIAVPAGNGAEDDDSTHAGGAQGGDDRGAGDGSVALDAARLGQLLNATGVLTPGATLAELTRWPDNRTTAALAQLEADLPAVGLVLHRLGNKVAVRGAGDIDGDAVAGAVRAHLNRDGLNISEIRLLRRILDGNTPTTPSNGEQVALGVLANARLIEPDGRGGWKAHPDVEFSLRHPSGPGAD